MPATHLLPADRKVGLGVCSNRHQGIPVIGAPAVHFPRCDPTDCYCLVSWVEECAGHEYVALSSRVVLCDNCKTLPEQPLTHGQLKQARDRARAQRKRVVAARHSAAALAWERRLIALNDDISAATSEEERAAAVQRLRDAVAHRDRFGAKAA